MKTSSTHTIKKDEIGDTIFLFAFHSFDVYIFKSVRYFTILTSRRGLIKYIDQFIHKLRTYWAHVLTVVRMALIQKGVDLEVQRERSALVTRDLQ